VEKAEAEREEAEVAVDWAGEAMGAAMEAEKAEARAAGWAAAKEVAETVEVGWEADG
jgi:hypothetical protein